jgi:peroxiredoxin family protein
MQAATNNITETRTSPSIEERLAALESRMAEVEPRTVSNKATIVVFSSDLDKVLAALIIATGASAMGMQVSLFHTFWGLSPLRRTRDLQAKGFLETAMNLMTPAGLQELAPSKMAFGGVGARLLRKMMKDKGVQSPEELFELARELGVRVLACEMSMDVLGIRREELIEGVEIAGAAAYLAEAADSKVTLFI